MLKMRRILIVEDEDDSREGLRMLLEASGYDVETAADGIDGLAKLESCSADAAIIDIDLPGMNGYDIARNARSNEALRRVKLIALTGFGRAKDRQAAHEAGFDRHLTKPVSFATLRNEIEQR
ncbi:MAG: response regulator [Gammaproteobacteria bacterium]|nr:response regulator [Gammaproteobacteria bacterium]